jgi:DnaJ-class molecular chaperone
MVKQDCNRCAGTGIGQHGPVDTSRCSSCNGTGCITRHGADYERAMDLKFELMRDLDYEREERP